ncbi:OB-fold nucleic acid binding domain, AA-tRNA synthetase-type [Kalmanozyma brasiliensis GHG001]|uniref:Probable aspartate--tRNA ligase, cytoplasmic n=1 Tax=Kalmanozyma brasiliensis (strain GHG001) TaxID=1365824 RepID=V5EYK7_KALBG|nr:OB-fold nucleic acid binding domain, AA-tRNA synthetase-type [Kalmanozyma brasiliensis GHG001]EST07854.1 OB-fold nucleic acid binding domain, AA-tRNA synthetase-type [Kalmanozyma brasiliensis GHG001]
MLKRAVATLTKDSSSSGENGHSKSSSTPSTGHTTPNPPPSAKSTGDVTGQTDPSDKKFRLSHIFSGHSLPGTRRSTSRAASLDEPRPSAVKKAQKVEEKERRALEQEQVKKRIAMARKQSDLRAAQVETPEQRARYGEQYPQQWNESHDKWADIFTICDDADIGDTVTLRARIHTIRDVSSHLVFIVLRQQISTIQAVLAEEDGITTGHMVRWAKRLPLESIVMVRGKLQKPREPITGATTQQAEIKVYELFLVAPPKETLPFNVYDADLVLKKSDDEASHSGHGTDSDGEGGPVRDENHSIERSEGPVITQRVRLTNRIIDLRTPTAQAIFRINAAICTAFRSHLDKSKFMEIHTPKLQGGASESGSSVFMLDYFGRPACLAQSPQLFKQMCIAADMKRVYEIGPVFRAENSNTPRHLTEYTGLDIEMEIVHYYDAIRVIDGMLKSIFVALRDNFKAERELIKRHFPHEDLTYPEDTLILPFAQGVRLLVESGYVEEDGSIPKEDEDLSTRAEIRLGGVIKEKYNTDYYILDKFPTSVRPFYAMEDKENPKVTNSFDIFIRGQEICTGGQRIHDIEELERKMQRLSISPKGMQEYLEGFRLGAPPHAGCGIGLERLVMLYLNLGDVRLGSLFHRDPRSLPLQKRDDDELRHPEASTNPPPWKHPRLALKADGESELRDMQPLEKLIANYGDASNTAWLDERYKVWRHADTGAAVGYSPFKGYAMIIGDPLCDKTQMTQVVSAFLQFIKKEAKLKPIWMMVCEEVEEILGGRLNWCTLSVSAEERVDDPAKNPARHDPDIQKKVRHARKEGVKIEDYKLSETVPDEVVKETDERIQDWRNNRKGEQVHMTDVHPWRDMEHRVYYIARDGSGKVCAMVVLHQLSPAHGWHIKWALDFPGAPNGTIEHVILHALENNAGSKMTFGASATSTLVSKHGLSKVTTKWLTKAYGSIAEHNKLTNKGEFRQKLGAVEDRVYVCYPRHGLSPAGVQAIIGFFKQ